MNLAITGSLPANFEVTLGGVKDFAGNAIAANTKVPGYTTGLAPNMVSYWPLDVVEGTKTPDIISGYDMNLDGLTAADLVTGHAGKCFLFDNARKTMLKRVNSPGEKLPIYNHTAFTVSLWVNGPAQGDHRVFSESSSKANNPLFNLGTHNSGSDGTLDTYIRNDSGTTTGDHHHHIGVPFDDTWHHICYIQDSNAVTKAVVYIDGIKDDLNPDPIWPMTVDTTTIGGIQRAAAAAWFTGMIDDVAVWSRALDPDEVEFLYTKGTPTPPPVVLPLAVASFESQFPAVAKGDTIKLSWDVSKDATSVSISPDVGDVTAKTSVGVGSVTVAVDASKTYKLTVKRNQDTVTSEIKVAAIDGIASGWTLLDNFDRYTAGGLVRPWRIANAGTKFVDVNGNMMLSVGGGADSLCMLPLDEFTVKEGAKATLFARFYLPQDQAAAGIDELMGLSDKGIRGWGDANGDLGPDIALQNPDGNLQIGTRNGNGAAVDLASFTLQPQTAYNVWIDIQNDPIDSGDLFSVYIAKEGTANRTLLFQDYRSDRNPNDTSLLGPTTPDLRNLIVGANNTTSLVYFDDFYLSKSGYNTTVPRVFGATTPYAPVVDVPAIASVRAQGGNCLFDIQTQSGASYVVESRADLSSGSWQTSQTVTGTGQTVTVTVPATGGSQFFRIRTP